MERGILRTERTIKMEKNELLSKRLVYSSPLPQWVCALPFQKPDCNCPCLPLAGAHASTGTRSQLVLKGGVSRHPGNETPLFLRKLNLSPMLLHRQGTKQSAISGCAQGQARRGSAELPYRITAPAAGSRQTPTARREGMAPGHLSPQKPLSCSHPAAGSPQGEGCVDFRELHRCPPYPQVLRTRKPEISPTPGILLTHCPLTLPGQPARPSAALPAGARVPVPPMPSIPAQAPPPPFGLGAAPAGHVPLQGHDFASHAGHGAATRSPSQPPARLASRRSPASASPRGAGSAARPQGGAKGAPAPGWRLTATRPAARGPGPAPSRCRRGAPAPARPAPPHRVTERGLRCPSWSWTCQKCHQLRANYRRITF